MVRRSDAAIREQRAALQEAFDAGNLDLADGVRAIRKLLDLTQAEYAERVGVAARAVIDLERRVGNPTLETVLKLGRPFGLTVVYRTPQALGPEAKPLLKRSLKPKRSRAGGTSGKG